MINQIAILKNFIRRRYTPRGAYHSFLNTGEDLLVARALESYKIIKATYIDIGCHHPIFGNITYILYRNGGNGVLVEPNKSFINIIKKKRGRDVCVWAGAGKEEGQAEFYSFPRDTRNTFSKEQAEEWSKKSGQKYRTESISLVSLDKIIETYHNNKTPDLISLDTEGFEENILSGFSWKYRPSVFCVESAGRKKVISDIFKNNGYAIYAETPVNTIFIDVLNKK